MRKMILTISILLLVLVGGSDAIMPANWQTWQNYSLALFYDTPTPMILVTHPEVVENGTVIQEKWTELVPAVINVAGIAQIQGWRSASAYYVTLDPKLNET